MLEVELLGATITGVETEMIGDFLPDKVVEEVTEELGAIIVALETELVDTLAGEKAKNWNGTCRSRARET